MIFPPSIQKIFHLRWQEERSNREIGRTLKLGMPAVKTQVHRAPLHLREQLASSVLPQTLRAPA